MRRFQVPFGRDAGANDDANPPAPARNQRVGSLLLRRPPRDPGDGRAAAAAAPSQNLHHAPTPEPAAPVPPAADALVATSALPGPLRQCFPWLYFNGVQSDCFSMASPPRRRTR